MNIKYTIDGEEIGWVGKIDGKVFVRFVYQCGDDITMSNPVEYCGKIYDYPPTQKLSEELVDLGVKISDAKKELREINDALLEAKKAENWIINLSDFRKKSFWVFAEGCPFPISVKTENPDFSFNIRRDRNGNTLYTIDISDGDGWKQTKGVSKISFTEPTHTECAEWIESSIRNKTLPLYKIIGISDNLLSDDLRQMVNSYLNEQKSKKVVDLEGKIQELQKQLDNLK